MNRSPNYHEKLRAEQAWYRGDSRSQTLVYRLLRMPLFYSPARHEFNYRLVRERFSYFVRTFLTTARSSATSCLLAPCGTGSEFEWYNGLADEFFGLDAVEVAIQQCPPALHALVGDILDPPFSNAQFDCIICSLFFHHMLHFGFDPFLQSFHRLIKPGGWLFVLEPSLLYPANIVTRPVKFLFNNPLGEVPDEAPFLPAKLVSAMNRAGFANVTTAGVSFSHVVLPVVLARLVNWCSSPLLGVWPFSHFAWMVAFAGKKRTVHQPIQTL